MANVKIDTPTVIKALGHATQAQEMNKDSARFMGVGHWKSPFLYESEGFLIAYEFLPGTIIPRRMEMFMMDDAGEVLSWDLGNWANDQNALRWK